MDNMHMLNEAELDQVNGGSAGYADDSAVYYIVADDCVDCGWCARDCSVGAIKEIGSIYVIDNESCVKCGACLGSCPAGAIVYGVKPI